MEIAGFDTLAVPGISLNITPVPRPVSLDGFATELYGGSVYTNSEGLRVDAGPPEQDESCACWAENQMKWKDKGPYENVAIGYSKNTAQWAWPRQDHHVALLHSGGKKCDYSGSYAYNRDSGPIYNTQSPPAFSTGYHKQWNNTWTLASGHHWFSSDNTEWSVNGEADICKKF